jgi:hypothetical protein
LAVILTIVLLVSAATIVGVVLAVKNGGDGGTSGPTETALAVTPQPTVSMPPSYRPTVTPDNDFCSQAVSITVADGTYSGDLAGATEDTDLVIDLDARYGVGYGRWHIFVGTGLIIQMSYCLEDDVFDGIYLVRGVCGRFDDTIQNEIVLNAPTCSQTIFPSVLNSIYYVYVFAQDAVETGRYNLTFTSQDSCDGASQLELFDRPMPLATIVGATIDQDVAACGSASKAVAPGIWYKIQGNGNPFSVSTCDSTGVTLQLSVFTGECQNSLECVAGNQGFCFGGQSYVEWVGLLDTMYYVLVHGITADEAGSFVLTVRELGEVNDICSGATSLSNLSSYHLGSTQNASIDATPYDGFGAPERLRCASIDANSVSLWYSMTGTNQEVSTN